VTPPFAVSNWPLIALHLPALLVAVSLVYSATRHDRWDLILKEALGWGVRMGLFLLGLGVLLYVLSSAPHLWYLVIFPVVVCMAVYYAWNSPWYRRLREQREKEASRVPAATTQASATQAK
jgi:hypothetical protein